MRTEIESVRFVVPGPPIPQPRVRRGDYGRGKRGERVSSYREAIAMGFVQVCRTRPFAPREFPVKMGVRLIHRPPNKSKDLDLAPVHTAIGEGLLVPMILTPDVDNVTKAIADGLEGLAWIDDSQLFDVHPIQFWGAEPSTTIELERFPAVAGPRP